MSSYFKTGDKVLCFHQGLYYDAKCISTKVGPKGDQLYKIHYIGWKPKWDEWISSKADRIKEYNEDNLRMKEELKDGKGRQRRPKKGRAKGSDEPHSMEIQNQPEPVTLVSLIEEEVNSVIESTEPSPIIEKSNYEIKTRFKLFIPPKIEEWLQEDYYQINVLKKLPNIPANLTVNDILEEYQKTKLKDLPPSQHSFLLKVVNGVKNLFNVACGSNLIYAYEHTHYREVIKEYTGVRLEHLYGFPHFLRLFYILKATLETQSITEERCFSAEIEDILLFTCERGPEYFKISDLYGMASADYSRVAQQPL